jgi:hypothetical protein
VTLEYFYDYADALHRVLHILLAIPAIHKNSFSLTISFKLNKVGEKVAADSGSLVQESGRPTGSDAASNAGSIRGRTVESDEPRQPVQDLV